MASFQISEHEDFTINGTKDTYTIPALNKLPYDAIKVFFKKDKTPTPHEAVEMYKTFFLSIAPGLADEPIGDFQWLQIGKAYMEDNQGES